MIAPLGKKRTGVYKWIKRYYLKVFDLRLIAAIIRGGYYICFYGIFKQKVKIEFPLLAFYKLRISGSGSVFIGRKTCIFGNNFQGLNISTLSKTAQVTIGEKCDLGGVVIRCKNRIEIGKENLMGSCLIQDTICFGSDRITEKEEISVIKIGDRVWVGSSSCILAGSRIDDGSVISVGSVAYRKEIASKHLAIGNPIKIARPIEQLVKFIKK